MTRRTLWAIVALLITSALAGCAAPPPQSIEDVRITERDLPNSFAPIADPSATFEAFTEVTTDLYDQQPAATYAFQNRNGRSRVYGFSVQAPPDANLQVLAERINTTLAPDALASGAEDLPPIQMDIIGERSYGSTFTAPQTDNNGEDYIMRVNTIVLEQGRTLALVIVTFEDRTAAPVDAYSMARRLDSRLRQLAVQGGTE